MVVWVQVPLALQKINDKKDEARLLELVDKQDLGSCGRNSVRVRLPYLALKKS